MTSYDTGDIKAPPADLELQVKILYCQYGWDIPKIAATLKVSEAVVRIAIDAAKLTKSSTEIALVTPEAQQQYTDTLLKLKAGEVTKQEQLAPLLAVVEIGLIQRIMEQVVNPNLQPDQIKILVDSYKKLTQDAVINAVVQDEKKNQGGGPQVAVQILQFKD